MNTPQVEVQITRQVRVYTVDDEIDTFFPVVSCIVTDDVLRIVELEPGGTAVLTGYPMYVVKKWVEQA